MKKRISLIMTTVFVIGILSACGHANEKENDKSVSQITETECMDAELVTTEQEGEITISELINQRLEEDGKIDFYWMGTSSDMPIEITKDSNVNIFSYDGKVLTNYNNKSNIRGETKLDDVIQNKIDYSTYDIGTFGESWNYNINKKYVSEEHYAQLGMATDDTGNSTQIEAMYSYTKGTLYTRNDEGKVWDETQKEENHVIVLFGTFERIRLGDKTYMTFCTRNLSGLVEYVIIPDNEFTENKTVVYDTPGTEGITVNTIDYLNRYQAVSKEELEQRIVPSDSKKDESSQTEK
ncbi:hypothetical protein [Agathobacter sp.]